MKLKIFLFGMLILLVVLISFLKSPTPSVQPSVQPSKSNYDCIVVLGSSPNPNHKPNKELKLRLDTGIGYFNAALSDKLILSGGKKELDLSEAEIMKQYCLSKGVPAAAILLEKSGQSTLDNLKFTRMIVSHLNLKHALVVTSNNLVEQTQAHCRALKLENFEIVGSQ